MDVPELIKFLEDIQKNFGNNVEVLDSHGNSVQTVYMLKNNKCQII
jgi:hypothetical protein